VEDFLLQRPAISRKGQTEKRSTATKVSNTDTGRWLEARGTFNLVSWLRSGCQYFLQFAELICSHDSVFLLICLCGVRGRGKSHAARSVSN
jgi:hypothetical protein